MTSTLTLAQAAAIVREAVRDQSYRATPLGVLVGRYIRWLRNEYGATPATVRDYEAILARMSLTLADKDPFEVTIDDLRDVIDLWSTRTARTRAKVTSVVRAFWAWAEEQGHIAVSPAARIRRPRGERRVARVLPLDARPRLLTQAKAWPCSAFWRWGCAEPSSPASRSATSTPNAGCSGSTGRGARNAPSHSAGRSSPS
jgi:integrase